MEISIGIMLSLHQAHHLFGWITTMLVEHSFGVDCLVLFLIILGRYFLVAGGCWCLIHLCYPCIGDALSALKDRRRLIGIGHDIRLSVLSAAVFAVAAAALLWLQAHGITRLYTDVDFSTWWYLALSYITVLILQDGVFYVTHRLFHHPALYSTFHRGHHRSCRPTPWTSFAFDPPEAMLQALVLIGVVMLIPLHIVTLLAVLSTMTVWAIVNHLELDCLPSWFPHHLLGRWVIGPAHHALHHRRPSMHFGLYFTFWDRVCRTQDGTYVRGLISGTSICLGGPVAQSPYRETLRGQVVHPDRQPFSSSFHDPSDP